MATVNQNIDRLGNIQKKLIKDRYEMTKAEANLETFMKQREVIIKEMTDHGVTPENIQEVLARLGAEIDTRLDRLESLVERRESRTE
jgi:hypothetical protein